MIKYPRYTTLPEKYIREKITSYLAEDAPNSDITSLGTIDSKSVAKAYVQAEEDLVFAGADILKAFFEEKCDVSLLVNDSEHIKNGDIIARIEGPAVSILISERPMLNLVQRLCGIATKAARYVRIAEPNGVMILDTRKTTPGLRLFEKYAVAIGGAHNHRLDLSTGILIKDNHIKAAGSITEAVKKIKKMKFRYPIEIEVDNIEQIEEAHNTGVDGFLLDNMSPVRVREAVQLIRSFEKGKDLFIEASGGITLENLDNYVKTGIDAVSIGAITHSVKSSEIHLEFE